MQFETLEPEKSVSLLVKRILVFEESIPDLKTSLPFFADGYPGLMFQETENGLHVMPHNKAMPRLFLYGQTIKPIELMMEGRYRLIIFQLYPFVLKSFFEVAAKDLNDGCYDLEGREDGDVQVQRLLQYDEIGARITIISNYLRDIFQAKKASLDFAIRGAILRIVDSKGQMPIAQLCDELHLTERTLERRFLDVVGISAKQFSRIIQFQESLEQLTRKEYSKLADIVYAHGYADQSHFIRVFKAFTGKTPKKFVPSRRD